MTESNNGWITDRLPTKEDSDLLNKVWIMQEGFVCWADFMTVDPGQPWMPILRPPPYEPRWKPVWGERYFYCVGTRVFPGIWDNDDKDRILYERGNCFQTVTEAQEVFEKITQLLKEHWDGK